MDTDRGLARRLPPPPEQDQKKDDSDKVKERNVMTVFLNMNDQLMCSGEYVSVDQLRMKWQKEFIANPYNDESKPEKACERHSFLRDYADYGKACGFLCVVTVVLPIKHTSR